MFKTASEHGSPQQYPPLPTLHHLFGKVYLSITIMSRKILIIEVLRGWGSAWLKSTFFDVTSGEEVGSIRNSVAGVSSKKEDNFPSFPDYRLLTPYTFYINIMTDYFITADDDHIKREKAKARELRDSQWWKRKRSTGVCYYCGKKFKPADLTMDHLVPIIRGGKSVQGNLVPACKECNNKKKYLLPMEWEEYLGSLKSSNHLDVSNNSDG